MGWRKRIETGVSKGVGGEKFKRRRGSGGVRNDRGRGKSERKRRRWAAFLWNALSSSSFFSVEKISYLGLIVLLLINYSPTEITPN
jgi:hypothetical protein